MLDQHGQISEQLSLISPDHASWVGSCLSSLQASEKEILAASGSDFWNQDYAWIRPYTVQDGVLSIPVKGVLMHDFPYQYFGYATGYDYLTEALKRGLRDPEVRQIALVINSPGGHVAGCFDLADRISAAAKIKPVTAILSESAYSAAYALASAASEIVIARSGGAGSIGVVTGHMDMSQALEKAGYVFTYVHAGKHKVDGHPYAPLDESTRARMQARIDGLYDLFVRTVAQNRGLSEDAVRKTEALTFSAEEAVALGLADRIGSLSDTLAALAASADKERAMDETELAAQNAAAIEAARAAGHAEGLTAGRDAERARLTGILGLEESKERGKAALNLATMTDLSVDAAKAFLATLPTEETTTATGGFSALMDASDQPKIGASAPAASGDDDVSAIMADYRALVG